MARPLWEVADVIRMAGSKFWSDVGKSLSWAQVKVLNAIVRCRTAALGGHRDRCTCCGYEAVTFHSCRNRHCPKCQVNAREKWLRKRRQELLPIGYFHIVFSVPHRLIPLMWQNKKLLFSLLFQATGSALLEVAADPKRLGAEIGFLCILHTWGQTLQAHPHLHGMVTGGALVSSPSGYRWQAASRKFLFPVKLLSHQFRNRFCFALSQLWARGVTPGLLLGRFAAVGKTATADRALGSRVRLLPQAQPFRFSRHRRRRLHIAGAAAQVDRHQRHGQKQKSRQLRDRVGPL